MEEQEFRRLTKKERKELRRLEKAQQIEKNKSFRSIKKIITWIIVLSGIALIVFGISKLIDNPSVVYPVDVVSEDDHKKGNPEAKAILIEYSDFQCPACAAYASLVKNTMDEIGNDVLFVYRHYPLNSIHSNADLAARASEAAANQGKFWEMHDIIFDKQDEWANNKNADNLFSGYALALGLNVDQFKDDINSNEAKNKVRDNLRSGKSVGINGTPTFFLNGERLSRPPQSVDGFKEIINEVLQEQINTQ